MKCYLVLSVELLFIQGALFSGTEEENDSQYWKTRYLSGSDYGSEYNLNRAAADRNLQNLDSHSRTLFRWSSNSLNDGSNQNTYFFSQNDQDSLPNNARNSKKDNVWWPWSNYEEWTLSRKNNAVVDAIQPNKTVLKDFNVEKKKKKRRKKKKSKKSKKFEANLNKPTEKKNQSNDIISLSDSTNIRNNYLTNQASSKERESTIAWKYDSLTTKPNFDKWDNNELDNEIYLGNNYYHESIPSMNIKSSLLDKMKKYRNFDYDSFVKSYSSRNFTDDVNECLVDNGGCEGLCINTPGSYKCHCPEGFKLDMNKCIDINECLLRNGHGPCQDKCINQWGSYKCSCEDIPGTRLAKDGHTCEDINECKEGTAGCSHDCINTIGTAFCLCPSGFNLGSDWKTCVDINECESPEFQDNKCDNRCENTIGSYICL